MAHYIFKVIVVGDGSVGKTSIIRRYVHEKFDPYYKKTIGVAHAVKRINIKDTQVTLTLWDTGGQELFDCVRPQYYRGANGVLVVYDVTNKESFDHLDKWLNDISDQCEEIPIILVANKIDLTNKNIIPREEGERYALKKSLTFYETSAKTGKMVVDVLKELARLMLKVAKKLEAKKNQ
ncbi:Rab family GTPase [Candidatus Borrarchaeum sp.]|uniref:Rab family GTPase n=1 Tax=Candidatus Borrarchaeum sp. TaxID=2846742 RepID=UPI00257BBAE4|nr:Rab family GTPase [Candidatus Borrarchaeum sp.]